MKYVERKTHRTSAGKSIKNIVVTVLSLLVFFAVCISAYLYGDKFA